MVYFHKLTVNSRYKDMMEALMVCIFCLFVCLSPAGVEPDEEGRPGGSGRRAADRLARLRGDEEGCCSLRFVPTLC